MNNRGQHSFLVDDVSETKKPQAVVLLLGWWGAKTRHLAKYAQIYQDHDCVAIQAIADKFAILTRNKASLEICALQAAEHIAKILRTINSKHIPVIIHAFSNGGAFVVERLEILMEQAQNMPVEANANVLLVGKHLKGEIFDSAPAYPSVDSGTKAMASAFPNKLVVIAASLFFHLGHFLGCFLHLVFGIPDGRKEFWDHMIYSKFCQKQAFIFSTMDEITNATKLKQLIAVRRKSSDDIHVKQFDDSLHVQHYRKHPEEYIDFVVNFLDQIESEDVNDE